MAPVVPEARRSGQYQTEDLEVKRFARWVSGRDEILEVVRRHII